MRLVLVPLLLGTAGANFGGRTGQASAGCGDCHGEGADPDVVAVLDGPASARPGEAVDLRLLVASADPRHEAAGLNVAVSAGRLRPGPGQRVADGELTHDRRQPLPGGEQVFVFTWTAPAAPGPHRVWAAGNAVDASGTARGDGWAVALPLSIAVDCAAGACPDPDTGGTSVDTADDRTDTEERGCGSGLPASGGAALLALGLVLRRRRG